MSETRSLHRSDAPPGDWPRDPSHVSPVADHLARVLAATTPPEPRAVRLMETLGLVCAEDVTSALALPRFDNSAMDGYAVRAAEVASATPHAPVVLPVVGEIGAGQAGLAELSAGAAAKIMTGAPIPAGADAVVPYEWTDRGALSVTITQAPSAGQHLRGAGEDVAVGDLLVEAGTRLGPRHLGLLASIGRAEVTVWPRPRVAIISTGTELREPGQELGRDSIYDGNSYLLAAAVHRAGGVAHRVGIVPDRPGAFVDALEDQVADADLVITSGGVSQGDFDVVKEALRPRGVWFGPVAMQPGKPQGFGLVGERRVPIFTLPGNPVSAYVSFEVFVLPALRRLIGRTPWSRPLVSARLTRSVGSPGARQQYLRAQLSLEEQGASVTPVGGAGSHLVGELAQADCLVVIPADVTAVAAGEQVSVLLLDGDY